MMKHTLVLKTITFALCILISLFPSRIQAEGHESQEEVTAQTQEAMEPPASTDVVQIEGVVTVGSRAQPRSVIESAVPIDVLGGEEFVKQGGTDLPDLLRNIVPSYNVNAQPISDAATVVRPANLRGLAPDHTLLLVNGKRRHRASVIYWLGNGISDGAQGADLSPIPSIALKQVEVLRDGASAQYGSDAIAGVMDLKLKDNYRGGSFQIKPSLFQAGDGLAYSFAGNLGIGRETLWANLSLEYGNADETDRSVQRADALALIAAGNTDVADPAQPWGLPIVRNDLKFFANYGADITETLQFYGHGNYAQKEVEGGFYFRNPNTRGGVYSKDDGATLLVGRLAGTGEVPTVAIVNNRPEPAALQQVLSDANLFTFQELFPGGFTPRFGANTIDASGLLGLKGTLAEKLRWDLSGSYGGHQSDFFIKNTVNASLGPDTPTEFDPGDYIQDQVNLNLDITYPLHEKVFLAAGTEYRIETFEIVAGQPESWEIGPLASQGFSSGSNGFPGFSDIAEGSWTRANYAGYVETELKPLDFWLLGLALRGEYFDDFGSTLNYKVATNFGITDSLMALAATDMPVDWRVRASYNTGFRAPTPGQQNAFNVTTEFGADGKLVNKGTIPSTHEAAALVGGRALEPETSTNITLGTVINHDSVSVTVDYFNIRVEDRLAPSRDFTRGEDISEADIQKLVAEGITSAGNLQEFRFFTNEFETSTQGIDVVLTIPMLEGAVSLAYNWTSTEVTDRNTEILDDKRVRLLEEGLPRHRGNVTLTQELLDNFGVLGRVNYYGPWYENAVGEQVYGGAFLLDLEANYAFTTHMSLTVGVQNVLNVEPDNVTEGELPAESVGRPFGEYSPYGFGGAFWYAKVNYDF